MVLNRLEVERQAREWVWFPADHRAVREEGVTAFVGPGPELVVVGAEGAAPALAWRAVTALARRHGKTEVRWSVTDQDEAVERLLRRAGAEIVETTEILAVELPSVLPVPDGVSVRLADTEQSLRDAFTVSSSVWGDPVPDPVDFQNELTDARLPAAASRGFRVVAHVGGEAVSTGGVTIAGTTARLWGACTLDGFRHRGGYRACVALRLQQAAAAGCSMALVNGRTETSAPILERLGFERFGQKRLLRIPVPR